MLLTLQNLQHCIRTAYGDPDTSFGPRSNLPSFQGAGKRNAARGGAWASNSTVLLSVREEGYGAQIISLVSKELTKSSRFSFVGDTDLIHMSLNPSATLH